MARAKATTKKKPALTAAAKKRAAAKAKTAAATKRKAKAKSKPNGAKKVRGVGAIKGELPFPMKIRGNLHLRFKAAAAELGQLQAQAETAKVRLDLLLAQPAHVEVSKAMHTRRTFVDEVGRKRREFGAIQLDIGKKLGILPENLKDYSFDSDTGVVLPTAPPE
jgi:hypothetical protein